MSSADERLNQRTVTRILGLCWCRDAAKLAAGEIACGVSECVEFYVPLDILFGSLTDLLYDKESKIAGDILDIQPFRRRG